MRLQAKLLLVTFIMISFTKGLTAGSLNIVPVPMQVTEGKGVFNITSNTLILIDETNGTTEIAVLLSEKIRLSSGLILDIKSYNPAFPKNNSVIFTTLGADVTIGQEGYTIDISEANVLIRSVSANGFFYGLQTLLQLLPPDIEKQGSGAKSYSI